MEAPRYYEAARRPVSPDGDFQPARSAIEGTAAEIEPHSEQAIADKDCGISEWPGDGTTHRVRDCEAQIVDAASGRTVLIKTALVREHGALCGHRPRSERRNDEEQEFVFHDRFVEVPGYFPIVTQP